MARGTAKAARRRAWLPYAIIGGAAALGVLVMLLVIGGIAWFYWANRIPDGVNVSGLDVGGLLPEQAAHQFASLGSQRLTLTDGERQWQLQYRDLGVSVDEKPTVTLAQQAAPQSAVLPIYQIDLTTAQNGLLYLSDLANIPADSGKAGRG